MKVKLNVNEVAVKQLESAIWMYAYNNDEVAVHTIAAAAFELLTRRLKLINFMNDMKKSIKPEKTKEFMLLWNKPYNFFKHGEHARKAIDEIVYDDGTVELILYIAAEANLKGPDEYRLKCSLIYKTYFILNNPQLIDSEIYKAVYAVPREKVSLSDEQLKSKETLRLMLDTIGHTFVNGTDTRYTKMSGEK